MQPTPRGYVRLSRTDLRRGDTLANHQGILQHLASQHHLDLPIHAITTEVEQSDRIDTRSGLVTLLAEVTAGHVSHLLVFDVARLSRGMEDQWASIKRALYRHQTTLVTPRGAWRFDNHLDTTLLDIEAVLARRYRWEYSLKRQAHNLERTRRGIRSCGGAPYGYRWISPTYEGQRQVAPGRVEVIPEEYAIVEEIFRRIRSEGCPSIAMSLNQRGVPTSGARRRPGNPPTLWSDRVIREIVYNPWYAGHVSHRNEMARERGQVQLPREQWVLSEQPGDYQYPIDLAEWTELCEIVHGRKAPGTPITSLLTGILHCCNGSRMAARSASYTCICTTTLRGVRARAPHHGSDLHRGAMDDFGRRIVTAVLDAIDPARMPAPPRRSNRRELFAQLAEAQQAHDDTARKLDDLMTRSAFYMSLPGFGSDRYEAAVRTLAAQGNDIRCRIAAIRSDLARPDTDDAHRILAAAKAAGPSIWHDMPGWTIRDRQTLIRTVIARIDMVAPPSGHVGTRAARVTLHPEFAHIPPPRLCKPEKTLRRNATLLAIDPDCDPTQ